MALTPLAGIYRAPMRARDRDDPGTRWGLAEGVVAIGGSVEPSPASLDEATRSLGAREAGQVRRFAEVPAGSFVWARAEDGAYWLGQITGAWEYRPSPVGLPHARATEWLDRPVAEGDVPEAVIATYARGGRNFQRTHDAGAEGQTAELWAEFEQQ